MAIDLKITALPVSVAISTGDLLAVVQGGTTRKVTMNEIANFIGSGSEEWQESVLTIEADPTSLTPSVGDRHMIATSAVDVWTGLDGQLAEWTGATWKFTVPTDGMTVKVDTDDDNLYHHEGAWAASFAWVTQPVETPTWNAVLTANPNSSGVSPQISTGDSIVFNNNSFTATISEPALSGNIVLTLPVTTGTFALTSQLLTAPATDGSILFTSSNDIGEDNAELFWDAAGDKLGIGINSSLSAQLHIKGKVSGGTTDSTTSIMKFTDTAGNIVLDIKTHGGVAIGYLAGNGDDNADLVCIGWKAGEKLTDIAGGHNMVLIGAHAGNQITNQQNNTIVGEFAGENTISNANSYYGVNSGKGQLGLSTGANNSGYGLNSLKDITSGSENAGFGAESLANNTTGSNNTAVGQASGDTLTIGGRNTLVGRNTDVSANNINGSIVIGYNQLATANGQVIIGSSVERSTEVYINNGVTTGSFGSVSYVRINVTGASGTDVDASQGNLFMAPARGTGDGDGGDWIVETAPIGSPGSALNALVERLRVQSDGNISVGGAGFGDDADTVISIASGVAPTTFPVDVAQMWVEDHSGAGTTTHHFLNEEGDTFKLLKAGAITAEDATVIDATYGAVEEAVLNNVRTRVGELEVILQGLGVAT